MSATFASLEARVNTSVFKRLSNMQATVGGANVLGIWDNGFAAGNVGMLGMASTQPSFTVPTASLVGEPVGQAVVANAVNYTVAAHEPDGTGVSRLLLERAA